MSIVLAHRLKGCHALLELALRDERARLRPDERTLATIKKKKLVIKDKLMLFDDGRTTSSSH
ncbi:MAG: hypothetical protein DCE92_03025 [Alphaproteobacteria bacterium]|nr:MAG: hypothetical protein DCE92_03025 [Alphaproteobacteria bacterium]